MSKLMESSCENSMTECICLRKDTAILCHGCRLFSFGRVRKECPKHKNVIYLQDQEVCSQCKICIEINEVDIPIEVAKNFNEMILSQSK